MKFRLFPLMEEAAGAGAGDGGKGKSTPPEQFSREYVHELREENKSWRTKHQEEAAARKIADDKAAAAEKVTGDKIKEVQSAADARIIRAELKVAAQKAGMVDMDGLKLADLSQVKLDEKGEVIGAEELMVALKKAKPYLFGEPSTSHTGKPPLKGDEKPKLATAMTDDEYALAKAKAIKR